MNVFVIHSLIIQINTCQEAVNHSFKMSLILK